MGLKAESKTFILNQGSPEQDIKVVIVGDSVVQFRRANNDSLLFAMAKSEVLELCKEFYPTLHEDV